MKYRRNKKLDCKYIPFYLNRKTPAPFFSEKLVFPAFVSTFAPYKEINGRK
jgi:hypothetical protein